MKMGKVQSSLYGLCLVSSIALNLLFLRNLYYEGVGVGGKWKKLSWSQRAAAEAEAVAAVSCSGHGRAYLDGLLVDGYPVCECHNCFGGPDCSVFSPDCPADADGGDPLFLEPFWIQHAASSAILVAGWHRMSYSFDGETTISKELEKSIRRVHSVVKNAITDGRYIVFGVGSTQLLNAAVYALSPENSSSPAKVVAATPYYPLISGFKEMQVCGRTGQWTQTWALVKDETVYQRMLQYIQTSELGVSRDTQLRAAKLLKVVLDGDEREIFEFSYRVMSKRWEKLRTTLSMSRGRFSIQEIPPQFCTFFQQVRGPSPAYAWLKCEREEDEDCYAVLRAANIIGRKGTRFGVENRHVRLSLLRSQNDFELLLNRLRKLVSEEDGAKIM